MLAACAAVTVLGLLAILTVALVLRSRSLKQARSVRAEQEALRQEAQFARLRELVNLK